jgi:hypothetical protein
MQFAFGSVKKTGNMEVGREEMGASAKKIAGQMQLGVYSVLFSV